MFSPTLINEARVGFSREHTNRLQPNGDDTSDLPGRYGILGVPQVAGNGGLPALRPSNLTQLGHDGWVVSERFSNTLQFSDNLTKVYKSHTFKTGYMYQDIFFGSTQPPYARGEYYWDGRYTSVVNQTDNSTARAQFLLQQIASTVAGGVDFGGGMNDIRVSPFGDVDAFKSYHGAYAQDSWRVSPKLTVNYGLRWDYFSREQEREAEQANMVPGPPAMYLIPAEWRDKPLSASFLSNLAKDNIQLVYTDEYGSGLGKMPKNNFAPRLDAAYQLNSKQVVRAGYGLFYGAFENRGGNPSLGYNYPFQFTLQYQSQDAVAAEPPVGQLARRPDRAPAHRAGPGQRERQRPQHARRRVRLQDAAVSQLQRDAAERAGLASLDRGRLRRHPRPQPGDVHRHEQRPAAAARRAPTRSRTSRGRTSSATRSWCGPWASATTTRCR